MSIVTEISKRAADGKYVVWGYIVDPCYDASKLDERMIPFIPQRWVAMGVYENEKIAQENEKRIRQG